MYVKKKILNDTKLGAETVLSWLDSSPLVNSSLTCVASLSGSTWQPAESSDFWLHKFMYTGKESIYFPGKVCKSSRLQSNWTRWGHMCTRWVNNVAKGILWLNCPDLGLLLHHRTPFISNWTKGTEYIILTPNSVGGAITRRKRDAGKPKQ